MSDHKSLYFTLVINCDGSDHSRLFDKSYYLHDFDNADYIVIGNYLSSIDWLSEYGACTSAADVWSVCFNHITFKLSTYVPCKYFSGARKTRSAKSSTRYPSFIRKLQARELRAWHIYKSNRDNYGSVLRNYCSVLRRSVVRRSTTCPKQAKKNRWAEAQTRRRGPSLHLFDFLDKKKIPLPTFVAARLKPPAACLSWWNGCLPTRWVRQCHPLRAKCGKGKTRRCSKWNVFQRDGQSYGDHRCT